MAIYSEKVAHPPQHKHLHFIVNEMDHNQQQQDEEMAGPTTLHLYNASASGLSLHPSILLGYPQQPPFRVPLGHLYPQMTYRAPQQGGMWYPHPYMMVGDPLTRLEDLQWPPMLPPLSPCVTGVSPLLAFSYSWASSLALFILI